MALDEYPVVHKIDEGVLAKLGYKDGHVLILYSLIVNHELRVEPADFKHVDKVVATQKEWEKLHAQKDGAAKVELPISKKVKAIVGFKDLHVEIHVSTGLPWPASSITIKLKREAMPRVEAAFKEAREWLGKTEIERFLKGAE